MLLYEKLINSKLYLDTVKQIESFKFITNGKWDWEHGLGHYKRVAEYVKTILLQLNADERMVDLGMTAALLHDIGLSKGDKTNHAIESSKIFTRFIDKNDITQDEENTLRQAILDHSKGNNIQSLIGLSLVLADKLDVTYHRTINSSIQDKMNKEIQKIKKVDVNISNKELIIKYTTDDTFDVEILKDWPKAITVPYKVSKYLKINYKFMINDIQIDISNYINQTI
ncbi:hD domain protein [Clostridium sp. CAG:524]|nr:hD domain protein [Clostridium sp. CAG:524]